MLGIARLTEKGLLPSAGITAAIAFLGVTTFDMNVMLGLFLTFVTTMLSAAVLAFVLLRHQEQAALTTALSAAVMVGLAALVAQQGSMRVLLFMAMCWLSALFVSYVLRQWVSLKAAVLATALITVLVGTGASIYKAQIMHFWHVEFAQMMEKFTAAELAQLEPEQLEFMEASFSRMPELLADSAANWIFIIILCSVFIARYWQAQLFNAGGFQQEFHSLKLGKEAVLAFAIATALSLMFSVAFFAIIASALVVGFFIQGLSVLHCITKQRGMSRSWLTGTYVLLLFPITVLLLSGLGMADNFFRLREI